MWNTHQQNIAEFYGLLGSKYKYVIERNDRTFYLKRINSDLSILVVQIIDTYNTSPRYDFWTIDLFIYKTGNSLDAVKYNENHSQYGQYCGKFWIPSCERMNKYVIESCRLMQRNCKYDTSFDQLDAIIYNEQLKLN